MKVKLRSKFQENSPFPALIPGRDEPLTVEEFGRHPEKYPHVHYAIDNLSELLGQEVDAKGGRVKEAEGGLFGGSQNGLIVLNRNETGAVTGSSESGVGEGSEGEEETQKTKNKTVSKRGRAKAKVEDNNDPVG